MYVNLERDEDADIGTYMAIPIRFFFKYACKNYHEGKYLNARISRYKHFFHIMNSVNFYGFKHYAILGLINFT